MRENKERQKCREGQREEKASDEEEPCEKRKEKGSFPFSAKKSRTLAFVEEAKRAAESVWVLRHAMICRVAEKTSTKKKKKQKTRRDDGDDDDSQRSSEKRRLCEKDDEEDLCPVMGCAAAKQVLRVMEEQEKEGFALEEFPELQSAVESARSALHHRGICPWALGSQSNDKEPCLVCALVSRARATRKHKRLRLDFSKRHDQPDFTAPPFAMESRTVLPPDMRRSSTTEELALLLSDLSRRGEASPTEEEVVDDMKIEAASSDDDDKKKEPPRKRRLPSRYREAKKMAPPPPQDTKKRIKTFDHAPHKALHPPKKRSKAPAEKPLRVNVNAPLQRLKDVVPRSPSFSAAASSLLALTSTTTTNNKDARFSSSNTNRPQLLMPQC